MQLSASSLYNRHGGVIGCILRCKPVRARRGGQSAICKGYGLIAITAEADANNGKELLKVDGTAKGTWAFNVHYLLDGIKAFKPAEAITLHANTATTPVVLTPAGVDGVTYLVMPVQIRG